MQILAWNPSTKFVTVRVDPWEHLEVCHGLVNATEFRQSLRAVNDAGLSEHDCDAVADDLYDLLLEYADGRGVCTRTIDHRFDVDVPRGYLMVPMSTTVPCHCCEAPSTSGRSVMIRGDIIAFAAEIPDKWKRSPITLSDLTPAERADHDRVTAEYNQKCEFRREFICEACYRQLDNRIGSGPVSTGSGLKNFGLAGKSRGGQAAVYSAGKWLNFLRRGEQRD